MRERSEAFLQAHLHLDVRRSIAREGAEGVVDEVDQAAGPGR